MNDDKFNEFYLKIKHRSRDVRDTFVHVTTNKRVVESGVLVTSCYVGASAIGQIQKV